MDYEEIKENIGKTVMIEAKGFICGYKPVHILKADPEKRSINGKGIIWYQNIHGESHKIVSCSFDQINLYTGEIKQNGRRRKEKKNNVKSTNSPETTKRRRKLIETPTPIKRRRKKKDTKRRRRNV